jgi:hypothetical protein
VEIGSVTSSVQAQHRILREKRVSLRATDEPKPDLRNKQFIGSI